MWKVSSPREEVPLPNPFFLNRMYKKYHDIHLMFQKELICHVTHSVSFAVSLAVYIYMFLSIYQINLYNPVATWAADSAEVRPAPCAVCLRAQKPSWDMICAVLLPAFLVWQEGIRKKKTNSGFLLYRVGFRWI